MRLHLTCIVIRIQKKVIAKYSVNQTLRLEQFGQSRTETTGTKLVVLMAGSLFLLRVGHENMT